MQKYWNTVLDERGSPREGASVAVQQSGSNSTIYSNQAGTLTKTNPLTTDTRGYFEFYAAAGEYDLVVSGTGFDNYTITDGALVGLPSEDITFVQSGSGANSQDLQTRGRRVVYLTDYGTPTTDAGDALQKAHDALGADGGSIIIPPTASFWPFTTTAAFTKPVRIVGEDWYCSELLTQTASLTMITTTKRIVVENINFTAFGDGSGTAIAIKQLSTATSTNGTMVRNCYFSNFEKAFWSQQTAELRIESCKIAANGYGLYLENTTSSDTGDSFVSNCEFSGTASDTCIHVASTSGLNFINNKFNTGVGVHIDLAPTDEAVGNYLISNNSFEGHVTAGIRALATTGSINKLVVTGNQFSSASATHIILGKNCRHTTISGNSFNDTNAANGLAIDIQQDAENIVIAGNQFYQIDSAIESHADIAGVTIEGNRFADDCQSFYVGGRTATAFANVMDLAASRFASVSSDADYTNIFQVDGDCTVEVEVCGTVQGVGRSHKYQKVQISGATPTVTDLIALSTVGSAFDLQVVASGGVVLIGVKRAAATGTSITVQVSARVHGHCELFAEA